MKKQILLLMVLGILFSCSNDNDNYNDEDNQNEEQTIDLRINHYRNTGVGVGFFLTLMVQEDSNIGSDNWTKFYNSIEGFEYQPGFIYDIKVIVEQVEDVPADGSSLKYILHEITSIQEVSYDTPFDIDIKINGQSLIGKTSKHKILNQIEIDCNGLCSELNKKLKNQDFVTGTFKRLQVDEIQLIKLD